MVLLAAVGPSAPSAAPERATEQLKAARLDQATYAWRLSGARVTKASAPVRTPQGLLVTDYTVEARATGTAASNPVRKATFVFTGTVFSPFADRPGQKAGQWYLHGSWTITGAGADPSLLKGRHNPFVAEGNLDAALAANPAEQGALPVQAAVVLEPSQVGGRWTRGTGTFVGNGRLEGVLKADVTLHPTMTSAVQ
ncbi:MAG: hypothetical protein IPO09_01965 [Anaeromyxobacter sp.]|nr:hypothetical protein [Anaeromyxobacter sp.]MBL0278075.1 hypothetical protein [Anaeromyxobacter sp.]